MGTEDATKHPSVLNPSKESCSIPETCRCLSQTTREQILKALHDIGIALSVTHNTVTTDVPDKADRLEKTPYFWRIDHTKEIGFVEQLESIFSTGTCPSHDQCNKSLWRMLLEGH